MNPDETPYDRSPLEFDPLYGFPEGARVKKGQLLLLSLVRTWIRESVLAEIFHLEYLNNNLLQGSFEENSRILSDENWHFGVEDDGFKTLVV